MLKIKDLSALVNKKQHNSQDYNERQIIPLSFIHDFFFFTNNHIFKNFFKHGCTCWSANPIVISHYVGETASVAMVQTFQITPNCDPGCAWC